jgi:hypothetical protein
MPNLGLRGVVILLAAVMSVSALSGPSWALDCRRATPLPVDVRVEAPAPGVPDEMARFSGAWTGAFRDANDEPQLCHNLVVEKILPNGMVQAVYSHGFYLPWEVPTPEYLRIDGRIQNGALVLRFAGGENALYRLVDDGLAAEFSDGTEGTLARADNVAAIGCTEETPVDLEPLGGERKRLRAVELARPAQQWDGLIHNTNYAPPPGAQGARHSLKGTIRFRGIAWHQMSKGCPGPRYKLGEFSIRFLTVGDALVPEQRETIDLPGGTESLGLILSPGRIWFEPADRGRSRAAFPFLLTAQTSNEAHNGIATFLFDDAGVSNVWFQITQETVPWNRFDAWGSLAAEYEPERAWISTPMQRQYEQELAEALEIRPWQDLESELPKEAYDGFLGQWAQEHVSASGLLRDDVLYVHSCQTRTGPFPYCRQMRHGAFSVTKSIGAGLAMFWLAETYGDSVFAERVMDYVDIPGASEGWRNVRFGDLLNMAAGTGNKNPQPEPRKPLADEPPSDDWFTHMTTAERLAYAFGKYGDYPWGPGQVLRYNTIHAFILSAAMDGYLKAQDGPEADLWDSVMEEVLRPIGVHHFPIQRTRDDGTRRGIPIFADGSYPTLEEAAKIARLLQQKGRHKDKQLLSRFAVAEALFQGHSLGLSAEGNGRQRDSRYHLSMWSAAYAPEPGCTFQVPYMAGYGGSIVALLPNGVTALRFADEEIYELPPLLDAAWAARPTCPSGTVRLSGDDVRKALVGNTLYADDLDLYLAPDGNAFSAARDEHRIGRWRIDDDGRLCTRYPNWRAGLETCEVVFRIAAEYELRPADRLTVTRMKLVEGNPEGY